MKTATKLSLLLLTITLTVLAILGCSEYQMENPFYTEEGKEWVDPFNLTAQRDSEDTSHIRLNWTALTGVDYEKYNIYVSTDSTKVDSANPIIINKGETAYLDTNVSYTETYYYKMSAIVKGSESPKSEMTKGIAPAKLPGLLTITSKLPFNFGTSDDKLDLKISNTGAGEIIACTLTTEADWIVIENPVIDTLASGSEKTVAISIDRSAASLKTGENLGSIAYTHFDKDDEGHFSVRMEKQQVQFEILENGLILTSDYVLSFKHPKDESTRHSFTLKNSGTTPVVLTDVSAANPWIVIDSIAANDTIPGESTQEFEISVDWESVPSPNRVHLSDVNIAVNGFSKTIKTSVEVIEQAVLDIIHENSKWDNSAEVLGFFYTENKKSEKKTVTLENNGNIDITLSAITNNTNWVVIEGFSGEKVLAPGSSTTLTFSIDWDSLALSDKTVGGTIDIATSERTETISFSALKQENVGIVAIVNEEPIDFGEGSENNTIDLIFYNEGNAVVDSCIISKEANWIQIDSVRFDNIGVNDTNSVTITVLRENLLEGTNEGTITVDYGTGSSVITIKAFKRGTPILQVTHEGDSLDYGTDRDIHTVVVKNSGSDTLKVLYPGIGDSTWMTLTAPAMSKSDTLKIAAGKQVNFDFSVDRTRIETYEEHLSEITIKTVNAENKEIRVRVVKEDPAVPNLKVVGDDASEVFDIAFDKALQSYTLQVQNSGTGTLVVNRPVLGLLSTDSQWVSVDESVWGSNDTIQIEAGKSKDVVLTADTSKVDWNKKHETTITFSAKDISAQKTVNLSLMKASEKADVTALTVDSTTAFKAYLSWLPSKSPDFTEYKLYRDNHDGVNDESTLLTTITDKETVTFIDEGLTSMDTFYYRIYVHTPAHDTASTVVAAVTKPEREVMGVVKNRNGGAVIEGVTVTLTVGNSVMVDTTDAEGKYYFANPDVGNGTIKVSKSIQGQKLLFLDNQVGVSVSSLEKVSQDVEMTVATLGSQITSAFDNSVETISNIAFLNHKIYAYSNKGANLSELRLHYLDTTELTSYNKEILFDANQEGAAFEMKKLGKYVYMPVSRETTGYFHWFIRDTLKLSKVPEQSDSVKYEEISFDEIDTTIEGKDTTIEVYTVIEYNSHKQRGTDGKIVRISETNIFSEIDVNGVPYSICEDDNYFYVLYRNSVDGFGHLRSFEKNQTNFTDDSSFVNTFYLGDPEYQISLADDAIYGNNQTIHPLVRQSNGFVFFTNGVATNKFIVKLRPSLVKGEEFTVDAIVPNPSNDAVTSMEIVNGKIYVLTSENKLHILDLNLNGIKTVPVDERVTKIVVANKGKFGDYLILMPENDFVGTSKDVYVVSTVLDEIVATIGLTNTPSAATEYSDGNILFTTKTKDGMFQDFNLIQATEEVTE